ncbi:MAG: ATPase, T2SS/T4P/T4SS family [Candidatus Thorarchaeota archaeon]
MNSQLKYHIEFNENDTIRLDSYSFHSYIVSIFRVPNVKEFEYQVQYDPSTYNHLKNFNCYENEIKKFLKKLILHHNDFCSFNQIYNYLSGDISNQLQLPKQLLIPVLLRTLDLEKIGPLLIDDQIDEIYLDSSKKNLYIDHSKHGRCTTSIKLTTKEIESFIYRVALENDFSLNKSNPTMKTDFVSSLFHTRVTVDIPPLTIEDYHIDVRKFRSNKLRIPDLVNNGSLTINQALLLIFLIQNQVSISIIGPPNSGKTTMQNALIEYIPSHLRLLSVEDVLETTETRQGHSVKFRLGYDPQEALVLSKSLEIQKILHRSPDCINLGELSTKGNFSAFLNVLSVGVPSIQTIHGRNPEFLFRRLKDIYKIPLELLKTSFPHIFIELNVSWIGNVKKRKIMRITELTNEGKIKILSEKNFESFLSHPNSESGISTLDFLITHNQIGLNETITNLRNIALELRQETGRRF